MWIFLLIYSMVLLLINLLFDKHLRYGIVSRLIFIFSSLLLIVLLLYRGSVGMDWDTYKDFYSTSGNLVDLFRNGWFFELNLEPGFQIYLALLKTLGLSVNWVPIGLLIIILITLYSECVRFKVPFLVVLAFYILTVYLHFFEQIRMAFVYSIGVILFIRVIYSKNKLSSTYLIFLASSVQYIAIAYFIVIKFWDFGKNSCLTPFRYSTSLFWQKLNASIVMVSMFTIALVFGHNLLSFLNLIPFFSTTDIVLFEKYNAYKAYASNIEEDVSFRGSFYTLLVGILFLFFYQGTSYKEYRLNKLIIWTMVSSVIMHLVFYKMPVLAHRLVGMLLLPSYMLLANVYFMRNRNILMFSLLIFLAILKFMMLVNVVGQYNLEIQ
jgi:hypothetical protein